MAIESRPFGGVTLTGEDARAFRRQFLGESDTASVIEARGDEIGREMPNTEQPLNPEALSDLYEALVELLPEGWGDDDTMDHMPGVKKARAALAKAKGPC